MPPKASSSFPMTLRRNSTVPVAAAADWHDRELSRLSTQREKGAFDGHMDHMLVAGRHIGAFFVDNSCKPKTESDAVTSSGLAHHRLAQRSRRAVQSVSVGRAVYPKSWFSTYPLSQTGFAEDGSPIARRIVGNSDPSRQLGAERGIVWRQNQGSKFPSCLP